tara:strand:- start:352 stop:777 length:426 start_codon:yes stop_codon:yes gene_type:complete
MIKYSLKCKDCSVEFDSWFSSSKEFDRLKKLKFLNCENCGSLKIEKSLMSPNLAKTKKKSVDKKNQKYKDIKNKLKDYQKFVEQNFEFVGDNFAYEARSIHYNKKKSKKGIYGNASLEDIKDLNEEGIETETIPWIKEKEN